MAGILKGPVALLDFSLLISDSIFSAVVGEIKKLLKKGVFKYTKGDISTFGIEQLRSLPILIKNIVEHVGNHMTITYDIIICYDFNGSMTSWRLKMDNLFHTIPNFFYYL